MKTLIKAALCGAYKYSGAMGLQEALAARRGQSFAAVMLFHRVTDAIREDGLTVSPARFERICRMLRRSFRVVSLAEVFRLARSGEPIPRRTVAITFDDSYRDNLFAARVLARYGLPACFFLPTAFIGTRRVFVWDRGLKRMANLTWDDVREIAQMGFEIGSHTMTHPNLASLSHEETRHELTGAKAVIEGQIGRPVRWFAYPFGGPQDIRPDQVLLIEEAGYEACLSGYGGFMYPGSTEQVLTREPIPYFQSNLNLELHLSGCLQWFYAFKQRLGRLREAEEPLPEAACDIVFATDKAPVPKVLQ
jgi:peptidoglycan/xylan/chitin deacetylase (PgdA/CDA1 family)